MYIYRDCKKNNHILPRYVYNTPGIDLNKTPLSQWRISQSMVYTLHIYSVIYTEDIHSVISSVLSIINQNLHSDPSLLWQLNWFIFGNDEAQFTEDIMNNFHNKLMGKSQASCNCRKLFLTEI